MTEQIIIAKPDDWHLHLRDQQLMSRVVRDSAAFFGRAMVMPNLPRPITTVRQALDYRERVLRALPEVSAFEPLMTLYLTSQTTVEEILAAQAEPAVLAIKLYPAQVTTNSAMGVSDMNQCRPIFELMEKIGLPLSIHGEIADPEVDIFDREKVFIDRILVGLTRDFPGLKIIFEHISCREGVDFVMESGPNTVATITAHHLSLNRGHLLSGGIRPHHYCLPIVKTEKDRRALVKAAVSGSPKFFLGTDSAPHPQNAKESGQGAAGIYSAPVALSIYAEIFEAEGELDKLEAFASFFGADFYGLKRNAEKITLVKSQFQVPEKISFDNRAIIPLKAGETISWQVFKNMTPA